MNKQERKDKTAAQRQVERCQIRNRILNRFTRNLIATSCGVDRGINLAPGWTAERAAPLADCMPIPVVTTFNKKIAGYYEDNLAGGSADAQRVTRRRDDLLDEADRLRRKREAAIVAA